MLYDAFRGTGGPREQRKGAGSRMDADTQPSGLPAVAAANLRAINWHGLFNIRMVGFTLIRAWVYLVFVGAAVSAVTWNGQTVPAAAFGISTVALCCTLFASALLGERFEALVRRHGVRYLGPALTCVGTLLVASTTLPGAPQGLLCALGGVATGVGSGIIDMGYGELYRNVASRQTCLEAPLAFLLASVAFLAMSFLPPVAACILVSLLPVASGAILFGQLKVWSPASAPAVKPVPISVWRFAVRVGVCACLVGLADGTVRAVFMTTSGTAASEFYRVPLVWAGVISAVVIWGCVIFSRSFNLRGVYKIAVVIMAFFFQLLPIVAGHAAQNVLALAGYGTFNVLIWILLADIAYTYRLSSVTVFGIGWGMITVGVFLGSYAGTALCAAFAPFAPQALSLVSLGATLAVLLSYMFILKESDLVELTRLGEQEESARESADGGAAENTEAKKPPRFVNRCKQVAQEYGLTDRETEIMVLYAKGRSYARIQEELHMSRGTVTTHLRHVYQKLDVHDKQGFLDLIEGTARNA